MEKLIKKYQKKFPKAIITKHAEVCALQGKLSRGHNMLHRLADIAG